MTGRDLILYILNNKLENTEVNNDDGRVLDFITVEEAAAKFNVTTTTIMAWINLGTLRYIEFGKNNYMILNDF